MKFSIGPIPVSITPMFFLLIIALSWLYTFSFPGTLVWALVILISVLVHELGHALTALIFGQKARIELYGMGGMTYRQGKKLHLFQEFLIVLNGPLAGFFLCFLAVALSGLNVFQTAIHAAIYVNLFWTLVNLIPILPLDGGHLMRILFEGIFGLRGVKFAYFMSMAIAGVLGLLAFNAGIFIIGTLFMFLAFDSFRVFKSSLELTNADQDLRVQNKLREAERQMRLGMFQEALHHFEELRLQLKEGLIYNAATEHMAEILTHQNKFKDAFELLFPIRNKIRPEMLHLLHQIAFKSQKWQEAITLGNQSYQYTPSYDTAVINAICHAIIGEATPAIGWLRCAIDEGLPNAQEILNKREFDHIRDNPGFKALKS